MHDVGKQRDGRPTETLQATINGRGVYQQAKQKEGHHQGGAARALLLVEAGVEEANQPLPFQDAGCGNRGPDRRHGGIPPA